MVTAGPQSSGMPGPGGSERVSVAHLEWLGARLSAAYAADIAATRCAIDRAAGGDAAGVRGHWFISEAAPSAPVEDQVRLLGEYLGAVEHLATADGFHPADDGLIGAAAAERDQARAAAVHRQLDTSPTTTSGDVGVGLEVSNTSGDGTAGRGTDAGPMSTRGGRDGASGWPAVLGRTDPLDAARASVAAADHAHAELVGLLGHQQRPDGGEDGSDDGSGDEHGDDCGWPR